MAKTFNVRTEKAPIVKYNPILVKDKCKLPKIGASKLNKFLISNWSKGLVIAVGNKLGICNFIYILIYKDILESIVKVKR